MAGRDKGLPEGKEKGGPVGPGFWRAKDGPALNEVRWAMADIIKKWNFKVGAGPTGQFDRDSEDTVLSSHCLICKANYYYRLDLT
jgi:hypothetical protein